MLVSFCANLAWSKKITKSNNRKPSSVVSIEDTASLSDLKRYLEAMGLSVPDCYNTDGGCSQNCSNPTDCGQNFFINLINELSIYVNSHTNSIDYSTRPNRTDIAIQNADGVSRFVSWIRSKGGCQSATSCEVYITCQLVSKTSCEIAPAI